MSELLVLSGEQSRLEGGDEGGDGSLLKTIRVKRRVCKPSPGKPPALPGHAHGEADNLVCQLGPGQAHPQLKSVAESHLQGGVRNG